MSRTCIWICMICCGSVVCNDSRGMATRVRVNMSMDVVVDNLVFIIFFLSLLPNHYTLQDFFHLGCLKFTKLSNFIITFCTCSIEGVSKLHAKHRVYENSPIAFQSS